MNTWYGQWIERMKKSLVPQLKEALQKGEKKLVMSQVDHLQDHIYKYFKAMEGFAEKDVLQVVSPSWRSAAEKPFLFIGDFHPALFTTLAPDTEVLANTVSQIQTVMTPMLQDLLNRLRDIQLGVATAVALDRSDALEENLANLICIFLDASRLRRNVVSHILGGSDVYQAAHFLLGIAQLYINFGDPHLVQSLKRSKF